MNTAKVKLNNEVTFINKIYQKLKSYQTVLKVI